MPKKKTIRARVGKNLADVLSKTLVRDWYAAVSEIVCNAYDADAEQVHIELNPGLETLIIKDDGDGMDKNGLRDFFRLADSPKIAEPISPRKKRKRVGKYGIAKVLLNYLGNSFDIKSVKGGFLYSVNGGDRKGYKHPAKKGARNGTAITIRDLRFKIGKEKGNFDINRLQQRLQWDIPNKPDFNVFVNGQLVKKRGVVEYARVYRVEEKIGNHALKGRIYWRQTGKADLDGVRIYVNGRAVGDPSMFNLKNISWVLDGRTLGEVHADFLEPLITLDRTDFQESPILDQVKAAITKVLMSVQYDTKEGRGRVTFQQDQRIYENITEALEFAEEQLNKRLRSEDYFTLELSSPDKSGPLSSLNAETRTVYINARNRMFALLKRGESESLDKRTSQTYLKRAFLIAAAYALVHNGSDKELDTLIEEQTSVLFKDFPEISSYVRRFTREAILTPLREVYFNNYRLYDHQELFSLTGRSPLVIRLLHTSGALKGSEEHLFDKKSILEALKPLEGYASCIELADERYHSPDTDIIREGIRIYYERPKATPLDLALKEVTPEKLENLGVINVGKRHPLHFVPIKNSDSFKSYVKQNKLCNGN